jgi:Tol biopolymer transport system component/DNA-binding winged helix-turn-helix (wHTH) protein
VSKTFPKKLQILGKGEQSRPSADRREPVAGVYCFGPFRLDAGERSLVRGGEAVPLTPKAFDTLLLLVENNGRLLSKDQMLDAIWPDAFVEEKTLAQNVLTVRKALAGDAGGTVYIETVAKHGYRFQADVTLDQAAGEIDPMSAVREYPAPVVIEPVPPPTRLSAGVRYRKPIIILLLALAGGMGAVLLARYYLRARPLAAKVFRRIELSRLTHDGNVTAVGLSPDGKWAAFATARNGRQSLFVQQIVTGTVREIVAPSDAEYRAVTLSRDGQWVFYTTGKTDEKTGTLYRVSLLGGTVERIGAGSVYSRVDLSPDGKQLAFVRWINAKTTALMIANADGTNERELATRDQEDGFSPFGPAWSPDGRVLVSATSSYTGAQRFANLVEVSLADGSQRRLNAGQWSWIGELSWLADGSGLIMTAWDHRSDTMSDQVWLLSYPANEMRRITADINGYLGVTASADGKLIAATQTTPYVNFWVAQNGDWARATRITEGAGDMFTERLGAAWMPDGRIVYASWRSGNPDLWVMNANGGEQRQLTSAAAADTQPAPSPDGRQIVFVSTRGDKRRLWIMDADGGNQRQLAEVDGVRTPEISPDGSSVVFVADRDDQPVLWRMPIGGGAAVQLTQMAAMVPAIAPDGRSIACILPSKRPGQGTLALVAWDDGHLIKQFETMVPLDGGRIHWSPDGKSIDHAVTQQGVGNIWRQPVDGSAPKQLTEWKADRIFRFGWSKDGSLFCERGTMVDDVILIRDAPTQ